MKNKKQIVNHELPPIYDENSIILILGSIPSPKSREYGFYYSHPQNKFWKVISSVFKEDEPTTIDERKKFVLKHHIALWDVISSCEIIGASDSSIKNPKVNDINLIINNSKIKKIYTTGKKATILYNKYCYPKTNVEAIYLPSTSPANCGNYSLEDLIKEYSVITK